MLQFLLVGTFKLEHIVAEYFKSMGLRAAKFYRLICTYLILVVSKFVMLGAINFVLGDAINFAGPYHGVATFVVVVIAIVVVEKNFLRILTSLEETRKATRRLAINAPNLACVSPFMTLESDPAT